MDTMEGDFYIIVKKGNRGWPRQLSGRLTQSKPRSIAASEIAIKLKVELPKALFDKPQFQAKVTIPANAVTAPVVDAIVLDNVKEVIEQQLGLSVSLSLVEPSK